MSEDRDWRSVARDVLDTVVVIATALLLVGIVFGVGMVFGW